MLSELYSLVRLEAPHMASRWSSRAAGSVLPSDESERAAIASVVVEDILAVGINGGERAAELARQAIDIGAAAFARGASLHDVVSAGHLLLDELLESVERQLAAIAIPDKQVSNALAVATSLQKAWTLLSLGLARGYERAYGDHLRQQFRHLRHDLRNPLGTIKSVLALLEDESVPHARTNPSFRTMASRNARSLELLVSERLGDIAVPIPGSGRLTSLRASANVVESALATVAARRGATVVVEVSEVTARFDVPALELLLLCTLEAALAESREGGELRVAFPSTTVTGQVVITVSRSDGAAVISSEAVTSSLLELAARLGAALTVGDGSVALLVPTTAPPDEFRSSADHERIVERSEEAQDGTLAGGQLRDDLRGTRQRQHGEASSL